MAITIESWAIEIDGINDPIQYPDKIKIGSFAVEILAPPEIEVVSLHQQFANCFVINGTSTWYSEYDINLNPNSDGKVQAVLDTYSGTLGKVVFTANELKTLVTAATELTITFLEDVSAAWAAIVDTYTETNIAYITCDCGGGVVKTIFTFEQVS